LKSWEGSGTELQEGVRHEFEWALACWALYTIRIISAIHCEEERQAPIYPCIAL